MAVSRSFGGKVSVVDDVLSSHEQEIYPTISLDENCIKFEFQKDRKHHVDLRQKYLVLKLKIVKGRDNEFYKTKEVKKELKEEAKADEEILAAEKEQGDPVPLVTHVSNFLHSIFPMSKCTSAVSKFTIQMDCMRTNLTFPTTSREPSLYTRGFCSPSDTTTNTFVMIFW